MTGNWRDMAGHVLGAVLEELRPEPTPPPSPELAGIEDEIRATKAVTDRQEGILAIHDRRAVLGVYSRLFRAFRKDRSLDPQEVEALERVQRAAALTDQEVHYTHRVGAFELVRAMSDIARTQQVTGEQLQLLRRVERWAAAGAFLSLFTDLADGGLTEREIETLAAIQQGVGLTHNEIMFEESLGPFLYAYTAHRHSVLPCIDLQTVGTSATLLKKGELVYYATPSVLRESETVPISYRPGSERAGIRTRDGIYYRAAGRRGEVVNEEDLPVASRGLLLITSGRLFLHPQGGNRPLSILLDEILSYQVAKDGILVYEQGQQAGHLFVIDSAGAVEIFEVCLSFLLSSG